MEVPPFPLTVMNENVLTAETCTCPLFRSHVVYVVHTEIIVPQLVQHLIAKV